MNYLDFKSYFSAMTKCITGNHISGKLRHSVANECCRNSRNTTNQLK